VFVKFVDAAYLDLSRSLARLDPLGHWAHLCNDLSGQFVLLGQSDLARSSGQLDPSRLSDQSDPFDHERMFIGQM